MKNNLKTKMVNRLYDIAYYVMFFVAMVICFASVSYCFTWGQEGLLSHREDFVQQCQQNRGLIIQDENLHVSCVYPPGIFPRLDNH